MTTTAATSASSGSTILTALNAGSGIDTGSLVSGLVSATYDPKDAALTAKETANTAKISQLATLASGIDAFASALGTLISGGSLFTQPTTSDSAIVTATAQPGSSIGDLSAQIEVRQTAQAQSLVSSYFASAGAAVGQGTLTIATAQGATATITIDATNDSLAGIARTINAAGGGVTASVVTDASGARLVLKGQTGAANAFTITAGDDADPGLASLAYDGSTPSALTQAQGARDAIIRMDGVDITRAGNSIGDVIAGVTLNLVSAQPGTIVTLGAARPTAAIAQAVSDFVDAFNELKAQIDAATASPAKSGDGTAGALYGNAGVREMQRQLSRLTATVLNTSGGPQTLAEIGVATQRDGTLALDKTMLNKALATWPDAVEAMFNPTQHSSNPLITITSAMGATKPGTYTVTNVTAATQTTSAQGTIAGVAGVTTGNRLYASVTSAASGLVIEPAGDVASATITVDLGLGGALQAIRDALRQSGGVLDALSNQLATEKTDLADQRTAMASAIDAYRARLTNQFATMTTRVSNYKSIQSYLTQQIAIWTKSDN